MLSTNAKEVCGPRGSFFCPERVRVNRAQWLADGQYHLEKGKGFCRQIQHCQASRVYLASLSKFRVFPKGKEDLDIRDLAGILRASLQQWTVSYPSEKEMTNAHKGLRVSLNSLMDFSWLWHPSPVILLGRMWFSSHLRGRCGFPEYFFKRNYLCI